MGTPIGRLNRDAVGDLVLTRLGARRSAWNPADIRGEVERIVASVDIVAAGAVRRELAEDLTTRTVEPACRLLARADVPEHVRALTSHRVLQVEDDLVRRLAARAELPGDAARVGQVVAGRQLDRHSSRWSWRWPGAGRCWWWRVPPGQERRPRWPPPASCSRCSGNGWWWSPRP